MRVLCPYCVTPAELVDGYAVYPHRPDLRKKQFYVCEPCDARVGCHGNSRKPLGRMANAKLRRLKSEAHAAFDPVWKKSSTTRTNAYKWLAGKMDMPVDECHIGMFSEALCEEVVRIMAAEGPGFKRVNK